MCSQNYFEGPFNGVYIDQQITNSNIIVGRYSYYSGYYHGHSFDDCALYLPTPEQVKESDIFKDEVDKLIIGSFCSIATGVSFMMSGNQGHRKDWVATFPFYHSKFEWAHEAKDGLKMGGDTVVGHDVWIGAEAMIMPGVKIGSGAIIGARALVTKDVEPYTIVGGSPAKPIRKRFSKEQIDQLLEIEWWNWKEEDIRAALPLLCSENIEGLYQFHLKLNSTQDS